MTLNSSQRWILFVGLIVVVGGLVLGLAVPIGTSYYGDPKYDISVNCGLPITELNNPHGVCKERAGSRLTLGVIVAVAGAITAGGGALLFRSGVSRD